MKFPMKDRPFERMIDAVVDATVTEYQDFVRLHNRTLNPSQWQPVKKRENVTVYRELTSREDRVLGPLGVRNETLALTTLTLPKLLAVGTVHGNMHDMLLGTALHDAASVLVKSSYVDDALVDCAVLHEMRGAAHDDPFRYVALKWLVKGHSAGLNGIVAPRDMVTSLGFHVRHSVDLPECPSLEAKYGILRSRICTSFVFRQQAPDVVEVYMTRRRNRSACSARPSP